MNLKSRLFKKPWQQKDPETRAQAVRESDDPELKSELAELAQHDDAPAVRLAALKRINTEAFWLDARLRESDGDILAAADEFLTREVPRGDDSSMRAERLEWFSRIDSPDLVRKMAQSAADVALRRAALERISAQGFLGDCFATENDDALAADILARIDQKSTLERLSRELRKTRKKRAQAAADRLTAVRVASGEAEADQTAAETLVVRIEALSRGEYEAGSRADQLAEIEQQWNALNEHPEKLQRRFEGARRIVQSSLNRPAAGSAPNAETAAAEAVTQAPHAPLQEAAEHIRATIRQARKNIKPAELLATWDRAWNQVGQVSEADQALKEEMLPLLRELQVQLDQKNTEKSVSTAKKAEDSRESTDFNGLLDRTAEALESGDITTSHDLIRQVRSELGKLPQKSRPQKVTGRLQRMEGRLKEMRDYQHWSHNQHRDALIEQIEKLADSGQHPDAITMALKDARNEWQRLEKLEILPGDRKRFAAPPGQWRRFQGACKKAFESARPYFEKRQEVQEETLEQLDRFVEQGMALAGEESPDSKQLQQYMRKSRQAIRRMDDLPPKARGRSAARLRELMDALSARIDQTFEQIELTKRRLITEARALAHEKDLKTAIDKAKALQAQWQKAGSGRRKLEQKLWEEFREPIDPLFDKLKGERAEQKEADQERIAELEALCKQAEELAGVKDDELEAAEGRMTGLAGEWNASTGRPGKLNARFEKAEAKFRKRVEQLHEKARVRARSQVENMARAVQAIWDRRSTGESDNLAADLPSVDRDKDDDLVVELHDTATRLANPEVTDEELSELAENNAEKARQIVVEMEFLSGEETPESDRQLRMDYQVQRLARRMSERDGGPGLEAELAELTRRWYASLPQARESHQELARRFARSRDVIEKMFGG
jgi:DNA repair protein SbcC/Rad50